METSQFKYFLEPGSTKYHCPECGKKRFVKYVDGESGKYLNSKYGRCDREINCGYHQSPYHDKYLSVDVDNTHMERFEPEPDFIPFEVLDRSRSAYETNTFVKFLKAHFGGQKAARLISTYYIGTAAHWPGATVFWQIDRCGRIRTGKVMLYEENGRRVKVPYNHINWVHALLYNKEDYNLKQCLFGEHLLLERDAPVALVESEKTAIIASGYFPEFIWLASGALHNLKPEICSPLIGRDIVLFPDLGATQKWKTKAKSISYFCNVIVSNYLETNATKKQLREGFDLADYLINHKSTQHSKNSLIFCRNDSRKSSFPYKYECSNSLENQTRLTNLGYPQSWDIDPPQPGTMEDLEAKRIASNHVE